MSEQSKDPHDDERALFLQELEADSEYTRSRRQEVAAELRAFEERTGQTFDAESANLVLSVMLEGLRRRRHDQLAERLVNARAELDGSIAALQAETVRISQAADGVPVSELKASEHLAERLHAAIEELERVMAAAEQILGD